MVQAISLPGDDEMTPISTEKRTLLIDAKRRGENESRGIVPLARLRESNRVRSQAFFAVKADDKAPSL
jgi:hypothetical protein